jgi:hypothetical protein
MKILKLTSLFYIIMSSIHGMVQDTIFRITGNPVFTHKYTIDRLYYNDNNTIKRMQMTSERVLGVK